VNQVPFSGCRQSICRCTVYQRKAEADKSICRCKFYEKKICNRREHLQMKILSETNLEQTRAFTDENSIRNKSGTDESIYR